MPTAEDTMLLSGSPENSRQFSKCMECQRYATRSRMRELLALATVARLDFWPEEVVERRIYLTWLASRDPWFMLRTIPGTVRGVGGSVVPSSLPANPADHVIAPRRQFESLFATLLPKDAQVEVEMPDGRRFLMPRKRPQGRPVLLAGLNAREADELLAREAHELVAFGRHIDGLLFVSNDAEELHQGRGAPRHARSAVCAHVSQATGDGLLVVVAARVVVDYCRGQHWTEARARAVIPQLLALCGTTNPPAPAPEAREGTSSTEGRNAVQRPQLAPLAPRAGLPLRHSHRALPGHVASPTLQ